mmetsp:Transcript_136048/g.236402  ORF Transcript_136048/g.236402 Transcript_136048/m.236402 type:complete len:90 (-) Transcript_136048:125-394(-)
MWLRCVLGWIVSALLYGIFCGEHQNLKGTCQHSGYTPCDFLADVRVFMAFTVGAGVCWTLHGCLLRLRLQGGETLESCPDKAPLHALSI